MITEDYVSFETAKLLKEKGFVSDDCFAFYNDGSELKFAQTFGDIAEFDKDTSVVAPTLQMAMKWLREEKGIAVIPIISSILDNEKFLWDIKIVVAETNDTYSQGWIYEKQESACDAAIRYCLEKLI